MATDGEFLTPKEVAALKEFDCSVATIYRYIKKGWLKAKCGRGKRSGARYKISQEHLAEYWQGNVTEPRL